MAEFSSYLDNIISNPNAQILISTPVGSVQGFVMGPISIGVSADYNNPLESAAQQQLSEATQNAQSAFKTFANQLGFNGESVPAFSFKTVANSLKQWTNTSPPVFNVPMAFIASKTTDDVRKPTSTLYRTVMPQFQGSGLTTTILAPLGYQGVLNKGQLSAINTLTVQIGKWFRAPLQVMTSVNFEFATQTLPSGIPLYSAGSVSFTPFRAISAGELTAYLSGVSG